MKKSSNKATTRAQLLSDLLRTSRSINTKDSRPIQKLSDLSPELREKTLRVENAKADAYLAAQKRFSSRTYNKLKSKSDTTNLNNSSAESADSILNELEVQQRQFVNKLKHNQEVSFLRRLNKIEQSHNVTSFTHQIEKFRPDHSKYGNKLNKQSSSKVVWRTLKLGD